MVTKQTAFPAIKVLQHTKPHDPSVLADMGKWERNQQNMVRTNNKETYMPSQQFIADQMAQGAARTCDRTQGSGHICRPHCATSSCSSCPPSATLLHTVNWY
jgi:hypothetical protein